MLKIVEYYGFDGYFINIESEYKNRKELKKYIEFIKKLKDKIHLIIPHSEIILYDSLIDNGSINYQNGLSINNIELFNISDGYFTNYWWNEKICRDTAKLAKERHYDIYMGIDIFGRNTYGGGGFSTYKALDVIKKYDLSVGLFAPAWTYECSDDSYDNSYINREKRFWTGTIPNTKLSEHEFCNNGTKCISYYVNEKTSSFNLPFITNFDNGFGYFINFNGDLQSNTTYSNFSLQSIQPTYINKYINNDHSRYLSYNNEQSFDSGNSIKINGYFNEKDNKIIIYPLYDVKWKLNSSIDFSYVIKSLKMYIKYNNRLFGIRLTIKDEDDVSYLYLCPKEWECENNNEYVYPKEIITYNNNWKLYNYNIDPLSINSEIIRIDLCIKKSQLYINKPISNIFCYLGLIKVKYSDINNKIQNIDKCEIDYCDKNWYNGLTSVLLSWKRDSNIFFYNIYIVLLYIIFRMISFIKEQYLQIYHIHIIIIINKY